MGLRQHLLKYLVQTTFVPNRLITISTKCDITNSHLSILAHWLSLADILVVPGYSNRRLVIKIPAYFIKQGFRIKVMLLELF